MYETDDRRADRLGDEVGLTLCPTVVPPPIHEPRDARNNETGITAESQEAAPRASVWQSRAGWKGRQYDDDYDGSGAPSRASVGQPRVGRGGAGEKLGDADHAGEGLMTSEAATRFRAMAARCYRGEIVQVCNSEQSRRRGLWRRPKWATRTR